MEKTTHLIRNDGTLPDVSRYLDGQGVVLVKPGTSLSLVRHAGPPPKDWWIANTMIERKEAQ